MHLQTYKNMNNDKASFRVSAVLAFHLNYPISATRTKTQSTGWGMTPLHCTGHTSQLHSGWQAAPAEAKPLPACGVGAQGTVLPAPTTAYGLMSSAFGRQRHATAFHPEFTLTQIWRLKALILRLIRLIEFAFRIFWSHEHHTKKPLGRAAEFWLQASGTSSLFISHVRYLSYEALSSSVSCRSHHGSLRGPWAQEPPWGRSDRAQHIPHLQLQLRVKRLQQRK